MIVIFSVGVGRTRPGRIVLASMDVVVGLCSRLTAAVLLLAATPVLAGLYILHKVLDRDGGPFLYKGARLGLGKRFFHIYKIRTLVVNAEAQLQGRLHKDGENMETPMGGFLRKTRLDELPQLWNVLRGDMAFVGPRPERQCVYESFCRDIPGYDARFAVKPGVTGLSQFLTPHGTSKRLRTRIDAILLRKMNNPFWRVYILAWTGGGVVGKVAGEAGRYMKRFLRREEQSEVMLRLFDPHYNRDHLTLIKTMHLDNGNMSMRSESPMQQGQVVHFRMFRRHKRKVRSARCRGVVTGVVNSMSPAFCGSTYTVKYEPLSQRHEYMLERYILQATVA